MTTRHLHVMGIDPGGTTGWCLLTVPRASVFGKEIGKFLEWDYGELAGPETEQAVNISRIVRQIQSLDYKVGPACIVEDWTIDPHFKSTDPESLSPVRIGAMLALLKYQKQMGDATVTFQNRTQAMQTATDDRLRRWGLWVEGSRHIRDAARHAVTALRRASDNPEFAERLWPI